MFNFYSHDSTDVESTNGDEDDMEIEEQSSGESEIEFKPKTEMKIYPEISRNIPSNTHSITGKGPRETSVSGCSESNKFKNPPVDRPEGGDSDMLDYESENEGGIPKVNSFAEGFLETNRTDVVSMPRTAVSGFKFHLKIFYLKDL